MLLTAVLGLLLASPPEFRVEGGVADEAAGAARSAWSATEALAGADGLKAPAGVRPVVIGTMADLPPGVAARSRHGYIAVRTGLPAGHQTSRAVAHEVGHQFLFEACPAAQGDRLFHEAFAIAVSGEQADWGRAEEASYLPLSKALEDLGRGPELDNPQARRALARLMADVPPRPGHLPAALAKRLGNCEAGARWNPLRPEELASDQAPAADALVIVSRHSGEVIVHEGAAALRMPFGSTLKPFMVAGAPGPMPRLAPNRAQPGWRCGDAMPDRMDASMALLRSCNGWFLDWAAVEPRAAQLGVWGPVLVSLGLSALPSSASEAIGIRPSLRISPTALAHAYRLLAEARPDIVDILSRSAREGTLAGLPSSNALAGVAAKTGTVLDSVASPRLGWIVGIDKDVVVVVARAGTTPRTFANGFADALTRGRTHSLGPAKVQVFGLVPLEEVRARCEGKGFAVGPTSLRPLPESENSLAKVAPSESLVCLGGAWRVRLPGSDTARAYAGVFTFDRAPDLHAAPGATARERNARRGSDLTFRTTRIAYAAGVVSSENARAKGEPRVALARVADSNVDHSRHRGRPVCDTTHCQVFQGTVPPGKDERRALSAPLNVDRWLPFSRGGAEPWQAERSQADVQSALGPGARSLALGGGRVSFITSASDGPERWEERRELPCESLRGPLKLPSCPTTVEAKGATFVFEGRGQGHGEGLDLEWAARSGLSAEALVEKAYGR